MADSPDNTTDGGDGNVFDIDAHAKQERKEASDTFDQFCAEYLTAKTDAHRPGNSDLETQAAQERLDAATWAIIRRRAIRDYQVRFKLDMLQEFYEEVASYDHDDRRGGALINSIRGDAVRVA